MTGIFQRQDYVHDNEGESLLKLSHRAFSIMYKLWFERLTHFALRLLHVNTYIPIKIVIFHHYQCELYINYNNN